MKTIHENKIKTIKKAKKHKKYKQNKNTHKKPN